MSHPLRQSGKRKLRRWSQEVQLFHPFGSYMHSIAQVDAKPRVEGLKKERTVLSAAAQLMLLHAPE